MFMEWAREHQLKDVMGILFGLHHYRICDVVHPGTNCVSHFLGFTYEAFWRAFPMYATLHSVTTLVFLLLKLRSFVVARAFHRSLVLPPAADAALVADRAPYGDELPPCPRDANSARDRRPSTDATNENGDRALALHRDDSMRAFHSAKAEDDNNEDEEEEEEEEKEEEEEEERKSIEKRRGLTRRELARMVSCCVRNLWSYLRSPGHVCILLRFVLTQVLPKLALNIARSSLFLGLYCASGWFGACIAQRSFLMKDVRWFYPVLALPGLASLIEVPARRRELALYCLPKAMESCYAVCRKYDLIPRPMQYFKNGEVFLFSVSSALTLFCYVNGKQSIKPTFLHLMNWLWA